MSEIDATDRRVLLLLDEDGRMPTAMIASRLGLARGTVQARLEKLRESGALRLHSARITPAALGRPVGASVQVELDQHQIGEAIAALADLPEVLECFAPAGSTDLLLRVVAKSPEDLYRVSEEIRLCPGITRTSTSLFLREVIPYRVTGLLAEGSAQRRRTGEPQQRRAR
ncbi:Lrp/AsnC family transcriptional regulator [Leucobacter triazinivorans]|uniref:Lrp/AsnC family transcriptional regulator n=1 Tax=Leucobacter triazinivorans TaxID=1784719 RepID=A0A4V0Z1H1_9MICO|nr:Lrp/AsnC family transcriptional regulator [Leucobacter triazinivorans]QBE48389.1 Lrp/AsnC family transcriptional regulator [Leucobacter triazinivorans]